MDDDVAAELSVMTRLYAMATRFAHDGDLAALLVSTVDEAISIAGADIGCIELFHETDGRLTVAAQRGLEPSLAGLWRDPNSIFDGTDHLVVDDLETSDLIAEGHARDALSAAEVRTLHAHALRGRSGKIVGVLSTHRRRPHTPTERELRLLELLARQFADAVERTRAVETRAQSSARAEWAERVRETEELFRSTVDNMPVNLVLTDRDGRVLYLNRTLMALVAKICPQPRGSVIGMAGAEVWPEDIWIPLRRNIERAVATGERQTYELAAKHPNGQTMVREWAVVPLAGPDGEVRRILAMSYDITAQRRLVDELRAADRRKSELIAVLSHELRNPLAAIRSSVYAIGHEGLEKHERERAREIIDRQVGHLVRLVDDLLDVTRIAQNKVQLKRRPLDINELVRATIEDNRAHLEGGGARLETKLADRPLHVDADAARIAQVVMNLLANAAKFTPAGGTVTVSVSTDGEGGVLVRVTDDGRGIEPTLLPHVFEPFIQGNQSLDRTEGGLGLGLALVKGLIDLHGGEVHASSRGSGRGTEIVVRLPLATVSAVASSNEANDARTRRRRHVLVIEDDPDIAEGLAAVLRLDAHHVEIARNGLEGLEKARAFKPDVVLCDIGLPRMDGYQVARAFRADETIRSTYLVALSGYAQSEDVDAARESGFDQHVAKPASVEEIRRAIADSLTKERNTRV